MECPRVAIRMECPECEYPYSEALYPLDKSVVHIEQPKKKDLVTFSVSGFKREDLTEELGTYLGRSKDFAVYECETEDGFILVSTEDGWLKPAGRIVEKYIGYNEDKALKSFHEALELVAHM